MKPLCQYSERNQRSKDGRKLAVVRRESHVQQQGRKKNTSVLSATGKTITLSLCLIMRTMWQ
jgi:hypothetical protein